MDIEQPDQLLTYLRQAGHIPAAERPDFYSLRGGVSNRTILVRRPNDENWVLKQALAKLRVPVDWFSSPARIHREALGLRWLGRLAPTETIPAFLFEDHDQHLLAMEAVPQPHQNWKEVLLAGNLVPDQVDQFGRLLGTIHREAYHQRAQVGPAFADRTFFESLRLEPYYGFSATQVPSAAPFLHALIEATRAQTITLVHGDYSPKNILIYEGRLVLLDHEVIHFGDPAFDLGFSMTHLLSKAHHLPAHRAAFAAATVRYWQAYRALIADLDWAAGLEERAVRHTLACLLARVAGRSPLEYLSPTEKERQKRAALKLMVTPPQTVASLADRFLDELN